MENQNQSEYDSPWKEALDIYFPEFVAFFFPYVYQEINWERGYETLDKELQKVVQDANLGKRLADKLILVRLLYERGYSRERIIQLFRLIDWMMILSEELKTQFETELSHYEEEQKMPYITSIERSGMAKATRESVIEVLETRFNEIPASITNILNNINNINRLKQLHKRAILIESLASFESLLTSENDNQI